MFDTVLVVWSAVWAALAAFRVWRYVRPSASGPVRVAARVERVEAPRTSGADIRHGVPVVVAFQNPATGEELRLPTTGDRNGTVQAAWVGRPVTVRFPAGQPYAFRVVSGTGRARELALTVLAAGLAWVGLVVRLARAHGVGWVPIGVGVLVAALAGWATAVQQRQSRRRARLLSGAAETTARVVASLESTHRDDDGHTHTSYVPVMAFTTADGREVTAVPPYYTARSGPHTLGVETPVRYAPADPSVLAFDTTHDRRANGCGTIALAALTLAGAAAAITGVVLLSTSSPSDGSSLIPGSVYDAPYDVTGDAN